MGEDDRPRGPRTARILAAGVAFLCVGMILAIAGVNIGGLFLPGVIGIAVGHLMIAIAAILRLTPAASTRRAP